MRVAVQNNTPMSVGGGHHSNMNKTIGDRVSSMMPLAGAADHFVFQTSQKKGDVMAATSSISSITPSQ